MNWKLFAPALATTVVFADAPSSSDMAEKPAAPYELTLPKSDNRPYFAVDFLFWAVKEEGNNYAVTGSAITVPGTTDPNTGKTAPALTSQGSVYAPKYQAKPGFKVSWGMNLEHGDWDLDTNYVWLRSTENGSTSSNNINAGLIPLFAYSANNSILNTTTLLNTSSATGFVARASSSWSFLFNNINVELGKRIPSGSSFVVRPHFGLQGSWQHQHFKTNYTVNSLSTQTSVLGNNQTLFNQHFWGIGPRAGIDGLWQCCRHLGLFGNSGLGLLWGQFKGVGKSYDTNTAQSYSHVLIANQKNQFMTLSPVIELALGLSSDWEFAKTYRVVASIAWNTQVWFCQNQHSSTLSDINLTMQGLNAGLRFDF